MSHNDSHYFQQLPERFERLQSLECKVEDRFSKGFNWCSLRRCENEIESRSLQSGPENGSIGGDNLGLPNLVILLSVVQKKTLSVPIAGHVLAEHLKLDFTNWPDNCV